MNKPETEPSQAQFQTDPPMATGDTLDQAVKFQETLINNPDRLEKKGKPIRDSRAGRTSRLDRSPVYPR